MFLLFHATESEIFNVGKLGLLFADNSALKALQKKFLLQQIYTNKLLQEFVTQKFHSKSKIRIYWQYSSLIAFNFFTTFML